MCQSLAEGGRRCAAHTRPRFESALDGYRATITSRVNSNRVAEATARLRLAAHEYAMTPEGTEKLGALADQLETEKGMIAAAWAIRDAQEAVLPEQPTGETVALDRLANAERDLAAKIRSRDRALEALKEAQAEAELKGDILQLIKEKENLGLNDPEFRKAVSLQDEAIDKAHALLTKTYEKHGVRTGLARLYANDTLFDAHRSLDPLGIPEEDPQPYFLDRREIPIKTKRNNDAAATKAAKEELEGSDEWNIAVEALRDASEAVVQNHQRLRDKKKELQARYDEAATASRVVWQHSEKVRSYTEKIEAAETKVHRERRRVRDGVPGTAEDVKPSDISAVPVSQDGKIGMWIMMRDLKGINRWQRVATIEPDTNGGRMGAAIMRTESGTEVTITRHLYRNTSGLQESESWFSSDKGLSPRGMAVEAGPNAGTIQTRLVGFYDSTD